ncbi:hypothetical protein BREVUG8_10398 [Brevundimonas sp. G8]|nr:hypothetical protein BREVUG8_10398 [Brevundimonas sp. G8]
MVDTHASFRGWRGVSDECSTPELPGFFQARGGRSRRQQWADRRRGRRGVGAARDGAASMDDAVRGAGDGDDASPPSPSDMSVERQRPAPGLIHHSDRGIQYAAEAYRSGLARSGITPSMSRKGDCWDNAPMQSFFHTLKTECVHHRVYATRDQARRDLFGYIEGFSIPVACTRHWATSAPPRPNAERLNPVHFCGGRSVDGDYRGLRRGNLRLVATSTPAVAQHVLHSFGNGTDLRNAYFRAHALRT